MDQKLSIILQGYSFSKESLNLIVDSYLRFGFNDIIVSSYSWCVDNDYLKDKVTLIYNDEFYNDQEPIYSQLTEGVEDLKVKSNVKKRLNVNYQIQTTVAGINKALELFPDNEFVIKQRCDMMLLNIEDCIESNLKRLKKLDNPDNKMFTYPFYDSILDSDVDWLYNDWFYLTSIDNLKKLFDIPFVYNWKKKPEQYIMHTYVRSIDRELTWSKFKEIYLKNWNVYPILYWYKTRGILTDNIRFFPYKHKKLIPMLE